MTSHFMGRVYSKNGSTRRCASKSEGLSVHAKGQNAYIRVNVWHNEKEGHDQFEVELVEMHTNNKLRTIERGKLQ